MGLKETLRPLVCKERCTTLNEAIELAIILEDGKKFTIVSNQRSSWTRVSRWYVPLASTLPPINEGIVKETRALHMIKTKKARKRKVSIMAKR